MRSIRRDSLISQHLHRLADLALVLGTLVGAYAVKENFLIGLRTQPLDARTVGLGFGMIALCWVMVTSLLDTYAYKRRLAREIGNLAAALALTIPFVVTLIYFTRLFDVPRWVVVLWALLGAAGLIVSRVVKTTIQRELQRRGKLLRGVIIVGTGSVAQHLAKRFRRKYELGYRFLGFIADDVDADLPQAALGKLDDLERVLDRHPVDEVVVALPASDHDRITDIAYRCRSFDLRLRIVPDWLDIIMVQATFQNIEGIPLIGVRDPVITGYRSWAKRVFDLATASFCIVLFSPLLVMIPVLIRLDSHGKALFRQRRAGENGRPFMMYKFRTMIDSAEEQLKNLIDLDELDTPAFKIPNDPRVTRVGRLLRRTSLDELPQFFNVLIGDMSMVGPRPEAMDVVARYNLEQRRRLSVKPGITGPMQIHGRGDLPLDERIRLELKYIAKCSVAEDIKYVIRTIPAVYHGKGAY